MASTTALTTAPTLMKLLYSTFIDPVSLALLNPISPRFAVASSVRPLSTAPNRGSDSVSGSKSDRNKSNVDVPPNLCYHCQECPHTNSFLKKGIKIPYKVVNCKEAMNARLDMPGIAKEGLTLRPDNSSMHEHAEELRTLEENYPRRYWGTIDIPQGSYNIEEFAAELKAGVLKVNIPMRKEEIDVKNGVIDAAKEVSDQVVEENRGSYSVSVSKSDRDMSNVDVPPSPCSHGKECSHTNPFLKKGPKIPYEVETHKEAMYVRLDMPGIAKEGLWLRLNNSSLHVNAEELGSPEEYCRRKYSGPIDIPQGSYRVEEIEAEFKDGVLKVKIPKRKEEIDVKENCLSCKRIHLFDAVPLLLFVSILCIINNLSP